MGLASSGQDAAVGLAMLVERLHIEGFDSVRVTSVTSIQSRLQLCCVSGLKVSKCITSLGYHNVDNYCLIQWQTSLTKEQTKQLEDVQRRALQIIFGHIPYDEARRTCNILSLAERRHELGKRFFQGIIKDKSNVLFYLLSLNQARCSLTTRLRCARQYPTIYARTNRYKNSFILFGLNHFQ